MDRMKNSMQQVPNAIPKVIRRTGGANSLELEKENFERGQVRTGNEILIKSRRRASCVGGPLPSFVLLARATEPRSVRVRALLVPGAAVCSVNRADCGSDVSAASRDPSEASGLQKRH